MKNPWKLFLLVLAFLRGPGALIAGSYATPHKYYLDANRAEEVLAGIALGPRLYDDQWLGIVGNRRGGTYTVRSGDTLWSISAREFGDGRLWRKLWEVNPYITNPHELTVGQMLEYYRAGDGGFASGARGVASGEPLPERPIPFVKLRPGDKIGFTDLDKDSFSTLVLKNRFIPRLIVVADGDIVGELTGGYTERESFLSTDEMYARFYSTEGSKAGDRFTVARFERILVDGTKPSKPVIGSLMRIVGSVKIVSFGEALTRVEVVDQGASIRRGDALIALRSPVASSAFFNPPGELSTRVVMGEDPERRLFTQNDIVLLNKGTVDGMKEGYLFRVYRERDLRTDLSKHVEPSYKAEIQVIYAGELASVGLVLRSSVPVLVGDTLIPAQAFADPPPPPAREAKTIELD